jgi:hypothetical protein
MAATDILARAVVPTAADFDPVFAAAANSATYRRLAREASGDDFPEGADPFSFTTRSELDLVAGLLGIAANAILVDILAAKGAQVSGWRGARGRN